MLSEAVPPITHPLELIEKYGFPETLPGTDHATWVAYFPKGDFIVVVDKKSDVIVEVAEGRRA